ncbi:conserved hypothetical protein [Ricinus communis]|uniref:Uncharacterized protein n=1 Tax=Ricinus communis TaxID=3988 RepID=B9TDZ8_RICCO|nr:conserved hypothetical protein [Ricinus communis]
MAHRRQELALRVVGTLSRDTCGDQFLLDADAIVEHAIGVDREPIEFAQRLLCHIDRRIGAVGLFECAVETAQRFAGTIRKMQREQRRQHQKQRHRHSDIGNALLHPLLQRSALVIEDCVEFMQRKTRRHDPAPGRVCANEIDLQIAVRLGGAGRAPARTNELSLRIFDDGFQQRGERLPVGVVQIANGRVRTEHIRGSQEHAAVVVEDRQHQLVAAGCLESRQHFALTRLHAIFDITDRADVNAQRRKISQIDLRTVRRARHHRLRQPRCREALALGARLFQRRLQIAVAGRIGLARYGMAFGRWIDLHQQQCSVRVDQKQMIAATTENRLFQQRPRPCALALNLRWRLRLRGQCEQCSVDCVFQILAQRCSTSPFLNAM